MSQELLHIMSGQLDPQLKEALQQARFEVRDSGRMSGGWHVRIRTGTGDEDAVRAIVDRVAPDALFGPTAGPTTTVTGYRTGL